MKAESREPVGHARVMQLLEASQMGLELYLKVQEVAALTGLSVSTLALYRRNGLAPRYLKLGRAVRYRLSDVIEFMDDPLKKCVPVDVKRN